MVLPKVLTKEKLIEMARNASVVSDYAKGKKELAIFVGCLVVLIPCLLISNMRGAIVLALPALFLVAYVKKRKTRKKNDTLISQGAVYIKEVCVTRHDGDTDNAVIVCSDNTRLSITEGGDTCSTLFETSIREGMIIYLIFVGGNAVYAFMRGETTFADDIWEYYWPIDSLRGGNPKTGGAVSGERGRPTEQERG